jgi:hypothetical protein
MKKCVTCNIEFIPDKRHPTQKFCSKLCRELNIKKNNKCIDCGEELNSHAKYAKTERCRTCIDLFKKGKFPKGGFELGETKGNKNINWINDRNLLEYPVEFNDELKNKIKERDDYICQNCGVIEEEHLIVFGQMLHVHHINYIKKDCKENNLITVCMTCNIRANFNRNYWQDFYQNKIAQLNKEASKNESL